MKRILFSLFTAAMLTASIAAPFATGISKVYADPDGALTNTSFAATGHYGIVADGIGLNGKDDSAETASRTVQLDVPGSVVRAYLYWAGYHGSADGSVLDSIAVAVDGDPTPDTVMADEAYGPEEWAGSFYHFVFMADVTSLVQSGGHDYTFSGTGLNFTENYGAGLMVVYQDAALPLSYVVISDGLDSFFCDYGAPQGPDSEITFFDFATDAADRSVDITLFAGGVENDTRPNSLWYETGSGAKPANLVNEAAATELTDSPPPYPLTAGDAACWDTFTSSGEITIPAGDSWLGLQLESVADVSGETGCEALFVAAGMVIPGIGGHCTTTDSYIVCTDKDDYAPGETVHISGSGFAAGAQLTIKVIRPDSSVVTGDGSFAPWPTPYDTVTTDDWGNFQYDYVLNGIEGEYLVQVLDGPWDGALDTVLATHTFNDSRTINWVTLDGGAQWTGSSPSNNGAPVTVAPSASISVVINVTTSGGFSDDDWRSTSWRVGDSGGYTCQDFEPDHTSDGTYQESFTITAPATPGTYDVYLIVYEDDGCSGNSNSYRLTDAVTVENVIIGCTDFEDPSAEAGNFSDADNAYADGGGYAEATDGEVNQYYGYDFSSIPSGATIEGISVRLDVFQNDTGGGDYSYLYVELSWDDGTTWTTTGYGTGDIPESWTVITLGGASDDWGHSWTRDQVVNHFRVRLTADANNASIYLDWVPVEVCYSTPAGPFVTVNQAGGQDDPTYDSPINFTVVFSESVSDFGDSDVTLSGTAGATTAVVTGSGTTYNVAVSGMTNSGTVIVTIPAGVATGDGTSLPNTASTSDDNVVTYNYVVPNPEMGQACGYDLVLALDMSGSIQTAGQVTNVKNAAKAFVDAFLPGTPSLMGLVEFSDGDATVVQDLTNDYTDIKNDIDGLSASGYTNWEEALLLATGLLEGGLDRDDSAHPDMIVIFTDGDPTDSSAGGPTTSQPNIHLAPAVAAADAAKTSSSTQPIRIVAVGVAGATESRLIAISGPNVSPPDPITIDTDVIIGSYTDLADILAELSIQFCGGTITVHKVIDLDGDLNTTGDQITSGLPVQDWQYDLEVTTGTANPTSDTTDTDGQTGAFDISVDDTTATVKITETVKAGYDLIGAECTGATINGTFNDGTNSLDGIGIQEQDIVSCTFYNTPACPNCYEYNETTGECDIPKDCDDGIACTIDSCDPQTGECEHTPDDGLCPDDEWLDTGATRWVDDGLCTEVEEKEQELRDHYCSDSVGCTYTDTGTTRWVATGNTRNDDDSTECDYLDDWFDTGQTRWVDDGLCTEIEEKEQEYRDYHCVDQACGYDVTNTQWVATGNTRNDDDSTECDYLDDWYNVGDPYPCCDTGQACTCQDQEYRDYHCVDQACGYDVTDTRTVTTECESCDDGSVCTTDYCLDGVCYHDPIDCDDDDPCTADSCDPETGCEHTWICGGTTTTASCSFEIDMLGEIVEIDVDCCNNSLFSYQVIYDPEGDNFISLDRGTQVICGDCVGCGSYPLLVQITEADAEDLPPAPEGTEIVLAYNCDGFKGGKLCSHVTFGKPVVLLLKFDPDAVDDDEVVFVAQYDPELGEWIPLESDGIAGAGELRVITSSFSMFAILAEPAPQAPPEPPPTPTPAPPAPEPEPPAPAHFVIGDLQITPSGRSVGIGNIAFLVEDGKNVTVSADIANDGGQSGNYIASLIINGQTASTRDITLGPGQGQEVTFTLSGNEPGHYIIQIDSQRGEFTVVRWINWPLIAGLATAFGLLVWAAWYLVHRKRKRLEPEG